MKDFWRENRKAFVILTACLLIYLMIFAAYQLPLEAALYPSFLCFLLLGTVGILKAIKRKQKHETMEWLKSLPDDLPHYLKDYNSLQDRDYRDIIENLCRKQMEDQLAYEQSVTESIDYYSAWVHQIKTPISVIRLKLDLEDTPFSRSIQGEIFRIEQYVNMVMTYQRLASGSSDYRFRKVRLDEPVKKSLRQFAGPFVSKGLRLNCLLPEDPSWLEAVTDEKWFRFVFEQLLSNALKYTSSGSITISYGGPGILKIKDTGIGISPEDLPRIFDRGYTGINGRLAEGSSGLGLYLCQKICRNLNIELSAESCVGEGTEMILKLPLEHFVLD